MAASTRSLAIGAAKKGARLLAPLIILATVIATSTPASALDLRPGLWEQSMTMVTTGAPPIPEDVLARMPPEQRAKLQAALGSGGPRTTVVQSCITKEQLAEQNKDPFSSLQEIGMTCKRDLKVNTATRMEAHLECTGKAMMTADSVIEAPNSQTMQGSTQMIRATDGKPTNVKMTFSGKWQSADCSDKDNTARPKPK